jgi:hypothetical protein
MDKSIARKNAQPQDRRAREPATTDLGGQESWKDTYNFGFGSNSISSGPQWKDISHI